MGIKYLWDTNTVIYDLQKLFPSNAELFIDNLLKTELPVICSITEIELLCWKNITAKDARVLSDFISDSFLIELEQPIKLKAAEVRKNYKIKLPDAIIAATALVYNLTLLSRNTADFKDINNLRIINPWKQ